MSAASRVVFLAEWTFLLVIALSVFVPPVPAVWFVVRLSVCLSYCFVCISFSDRSLDRRVVAEQERLRSEAQKAEALVVESMARAAHLRKQLDFLENRDRWILRSELECLELVEGLGA